MQSDHCLCQHEKAARCSKHLQLGHPANFNQRGAEGLVIAMWRHCVTVYGCCHLYCTSGLQAHQVQQSYLHCWPVLVSASIQALLDLQPQKLVFTCNRFSAACMKSCSFREGLCPTLTWVLQRSCVSTLFPFVSPLCFHTTPTTQMHMADD